MDPLQIYIVAIISKDVNSDTSTVCKVKLSINHVLTEKEAVDICIRNIIPDKWYDEYNDNGPLSTFEQLKAALDILSIVRKS